MRQASLKVQVPATRSCAGLGVAPTQSYLPAALIARFHRIDGPLGLVARPPLRHWPVFLDFAQPQVRSANLQYLDSEESRYDPLQQITQFLVSPDDAPADT